jgi:hypothetical protein
MSFRAKACAAAVAAACVLFAPAAMASPGVSHATVQVTGKQLQKNGLLPPSHILPGYTTIFSNNSGGKLEHGTAFHIPSLKCSDFWSWIGTVDGFGDTAFATESAAAKEGQGSVIEIFGQSVYQLASSHAATSFFGQVNAKYKSCRTVRVKDGKGGTLKRTVHARQALRVGGHQSLLLTEYLWDSRVKGPPLVTFALWTLDGTDVYMVNSQVITVSSPKPTLSSLMLKLIPRVRALK